MTKLVEMKYYNKKGEAKTNCYYVTISKKEIDNSKIDTNKNIKIKTENKRIILEEE